VVATSRALSSLFCTQIMSRLCPDDQNAEPQQVNPSLWIVLAALLGLSAVALGAIAAHALNDPRAALAVERASLYQLIHAVVLLYAANLPGKLAAAARILLLIGILGFCGAIELKYLFSLPALGAVAPAGGITLMLGWLMLAVSALWRPTPKT
jgi:uncharacterized membrane protein YgdD (TMEM256/DUF423 family)